MSGDHSRGAPHLGQPVAQTDTQPYASGATHEAQRGYLGLAPPLLPLRAIGGIEELEARALRQRQPRAIRRERDASVGGQRANLHKAAGALAEVEKTYLSSI